MSRCILIMLRIVFFLISLVRKLERCQRDKRNIHPSLWFEHGLLYTIGLQVSSNMTAMNRVCVTCSIRRIMKKILMAILNLTMKLILEKGMSLATYTSRIYFQPHSLSWNWSKGEQLALIQSHKTAQDHRADVKNSNSTDHTGNEIYQLMMNKRKIRRDHMKQRVKSTPWPDFGSNHYYLLGEGIINPLFNQRSWLTYFHRYYNPWDKSWVLLVTQ